MRELSCGIVPNSRGWLLIVGAHRRGWFPSRDAALRAAIVEAQRGTAAGFYCALSGSVIGVRLGCEHTGLTDFS
jgi:hypothetical protein